MGLKLTNSISLVLSLAMAGVFSTVLVLYRLPAGQLLSTFGQLNESTATSNSNSAAPTQAVAESLTKAIVASGDNDSLYTVTFQLSRPDARPTAPAYSFQTSLTDPNEPIIYTVNGRQISLDEFYAFQRQLAKDQFLYEERLVAEAAERHALLLTVLDQAGVSRNNTNELIGQDFRTHTSNAQQQTVARLTAQDIQTIGHQLGDSGIQVQLYSETISATSDQSATSSANSSVNDQLSSNGQLRELVFSPAISPFILLLGVYLLTFRSLRQFRVM